MRKRTTILALALAACLTASCRVATNEYILGPATYRVYNPRFAPTKPEGVTGDTTCTLYRANDGRIYTETWVAVGSANHSVFPIFFIEGGCTTYDKFKEPCQRRWVRISIDQDKPRFYSIDALCEKPEGSLTRIDTVKLEDLAPSGELTKPSISWRKPLATVDKIVVDAPLTVVATAIGAPIIGIYYGVRYLITGSGPEWPH